MTKTLRGLSAAPNYKTRCLLLFMQFGEDIGMENSYE